MFVVAGVLNRDKGVAEFIRHHVHGHRDSVGIRRNKFCRLVSVAVVDEGREAGRGDVYVADIGCGVDDGFECANADRYDHDDCCDDDYERDLQRRESYFSCAPSAAAGEPPFRADHILSFVIIHVNNVFLSKQM